MAIIEVTEQNVDEVFSYHPPTEDQIPRYNLLREHAKQFAKVILKLCPRSPDRSAALRLVREAVMVANASIALENVGVKPADEREERS